MVDRTVLDLYRHDFESPRDDHYNHWTPAGRRGLSTAQFFAKTAGLADGLFELGVGPGDRVVLISDDRPEWHMTDLAVLDLGAVDVPLYTTLTTDQIAFQVIDSGAKVAVAETPDQMDKLLRFRDRCPGLEHLIQIEDNRPDGVLGFDEIATAGNPDEAGFWDRAAGIDKNQLMTIIYTSGTTGDPKGVMISHHNMVENVRHTFSRLRAGREDLALEFLPLCHVAERMAGYSYMLNATTKAYCSVADAGGLIADIRPTLFFAVPRVYEKVHQRVLQRVDGSSPMKRRLFHWAVGVGTRTADARLGGKDPGLLAAMSFALADRLVLSKIRAAVGGRLKFCITGAAETPKHVFAFFHALGIPMVEAYGLTETSPCIAVGGLDPGELRPGWVGRALENLEVRLADDGELLVKGSSVMSGYWNKPEATAEAFDENGFFRTGDIAEISSDGFIRIIDRKKDLIVTAGGKNVAPQPIESRLKMSPLIDAAVLIGDRRPYIVALLSPDLDELRRQTEGTDCRDLEDDELVRHPAAIGFFQEAIGEVNALLARFEQIKKFRVLPVTLSVEGGHLTPTLKVKRRVVEKEFESLIDGLYGE